MLPLCQDDHKPYCDHCWVHATGKGLPNVCDNNRVWGYLHISVCEGSSLSSSSLKTSLSFSWVPSLTISLTDSHHCWPHQVLRLSVHTAPALSVHSTGEEPGGGYSGTMGLLSVPLSEYDLSGKFFMFLHMLSQLLFLEHIFQGIFLFWFAFLNFLIG